MLDLMHKKLDVYHWAMVLVEEIYKATSVYPKEERFVLVSQLRRAAISVCSNIAEGAARKSKAEKQRFYEIARSSLVELDTQLEISIILGHLQVDHAKELNGPLQSIFKMLSKLIKNLEPQPD